MIETIDTLLAAVPILLILVLMVGFRWNGTKAGTAGWLIALVIATLRFGAGSKVLFWAQVEGMFQALYVLYIIWGALVFFRVTEADGTLTAMTTILQQMSPGRALQVLLLAWAFASFLQGVGGFGVPVAVVAPLLVGMGFPPLEAVLMPSLGHAWAISFGSLGSSFHALAAATNLNGAYIAPWMAIFLSIVCFQVGFLVLWVAGGKVAVREGLLPLLSMTLAMAGVQFIAALAGLWTIAAMLGALAGLAVGSIWTLSQKTPQKGTEIRKLVVSGVIPYLLLLAIIFAEKFFLPLQNLLNQLVLAIDVPEVITLRGWSVPAGSTRSISIFGHPGALLMYAGLGTFLIALRRKKLSAESRKRIVQKVVRSGLKSTFGILTLVCMSVTMRNTGMISRLSQAMVDIAGQLFPLVSPLIGALGAFMTGSNTNSNLLFGALQQDVAGALGYAVPIILAIHNAGAAVGSVFAPAKVIVGCSTVGLSGSEGETLQRITRYGLAILASLSILGWIVASLR